mmetsp:Transcript_71055/g.112555  ORF Transcript_71055/g.112555 Transcript_71055/m.112555 type:complete len:83 (+) Transcript_71055:65-313(+)
MHEAIGDSSLPRSAIAQQSEWNNTTRKTSTEDQIRLSNDRANRKRAWRCDKLKTNVALLDYFNTGRAHAPNVKPIVYLRSNE